MASEQLTLIDMWETGRPERPFVTWDDLFQGVPHTCYVCDAPIDDEAWDLGNDGQILCPAHIGTIA